MNATLVEVTAALCLSVATVASAQSAYQLRAQDTLNISVANQADLTKQYTIDDTGHVQVPLVGRVMAVGLTASELADQLRSRLGEFFTDPDVTVAVERTKRVFLFGGVSAPGMYELTANMTLVEVLARAGYGGAAEALIIRRKDAVDPAVPISGHQAGGAPDTEVIRVNLREFEKELESGTLARNVVLEEGDTIYVPRFDPNRVYVSGQVRNPGAYSVPEGTTVLQALTLAGGATPDAALNRLKLMRLVNGKQETYDAGLDDIVQPRDTILVPQRFF